MKKTLLALGLTFFGGVGLLLAQEPVKIQLGLPAPQPFHGTTKIGLNLEMALTSDRMWSADHHWMARTFDKAGVTALRWGYSAAWWDAFEEKPLSDQYWSADNTKDAKGSFGFKEFVAYCKSTHTVPLIMLPVDALATGVPLARVLDLSRRMTEYVDSQHLETPVYLEVGNEPYTNPKLAEKKYAEALCAIYPLVKSIQPKFRVVAQIDEDMEAGIVNPYADFYDAVEWHYYLECGGKGRDPWKWYCSQDRDDLISLCKKKDPVIPAGKEYIIGEINVLWPDWDGVMAGDRRSSLVYLNLLLSAIQDNRASIITPWPSHWPALKGRPDYGWFRYTEFSRRNKTVTFPAVIGTHCLLQDYVLPVPVAVTSSNPKIRVSAFTSTDHSYLSIILINKQPHPVSVRIPVKPGMACASAHRLGARYSKDAEAEYSQVPINLTTANDLDIELAPESALAVKLSTNKVFSN
jgi:hypothetical protein